MELDAFYATVSTISFTLLGLWWVVVQARPSLWTTPSHRRMAYAVSFHFLLPGMMSIISLIAPDTPSLWRITFALAGLFGFIGAIYYVRTLRDAHDTPRIAMVVEWVVIPIYAAITAIALWPDTVAQLGFDLSARQVEGIILSILLFLGVQAAWVLMVEPPIDPEKD